MKNITIVKSTGELRTAAEINTENTWGNAPLQDATALSVVTGNVAISCEGQKEYNDLAVTEDLTFNFTDLEKGNCIVFDIVVTGGPHTITLGTNTSKDFSGLSGTALDDGTYQINGRVTSKGIDIVVPGLGDAPAPPVYTFANTHKMDIGAIGQGISTNNPLIVPASTGSIEFWGTTVDTFGTFAISRTIDDDDDFIMSDIQISSTGYISTTLRTDASNRLVKAATVGTSGDLSVSTRYHVVITKGTDNYAGVKIYVDAVEVSLYDDLTVGTYAGVRALVGNAIHELPRLNLGCGFDNFEIERLFSSELSQSEITYLYNSGTPVALTEPLRAKCVQENLLNNNALADNIGVDGSLQAGTLFSTI